MRNAVNAFMVCCAAAALQVWLPITAPADAVGDETQQHEGEAPADAVGDETQRQEGEDRWVASLAVTGGATFQNQEGSANSLLFEDGSLVPVPLRGLVDGDDLVVPPFVGGGLELMAPALPIPTRPRFFASGEILPSFGSERTVAIQGDPGCVRGPDIGAPCAVDEVPGVRTARFGEDAANGQGTQVTSEVSLLVFGASLGAAFPFQLAGRQLRIKPSASWIRYEVQAEGFVSDAACSPITTCTDVFAPGTPADGFLRETTLRASGSEWFDGIGPGLDLEVDTGRFGPIGTSLFLGARAYHVLGNRTISFGDSEAFDDVLGEDVATADFEVEVDPWLYRAHVGIRFQWLGGLN